MSTPEKVFDFLLNAAALFMIATMIFAIGIEWVRVI